MTSRWFETVDVIPQAEVIGPRQRVMIVTSLWPRGSGHAGRQVETLVDELSKAMPRAFFRIVHLTGGDLKYLVSILGVRRLAKDFEPDVLVMIYGPSQMACVAVPKLPRILYLLGSDVNRLLPRQLTRLSSRRSVQVVFVSDSLRKKWPRPNSEVIPNGVKTEIFNANGRREAKSRLGLPPSPLIMFGGVPTVPTKRYDRFLNVLERVRSMGDEHVSCAVLSGDDPPQTVAAMLRASDALVFTSERGTEGSPTIVKEALLCGTPVVSVDVGDVSRWVSPPFGTVVPWQDDEETLVERLGNATYAFMSGGLNDEMSMSTHFESFSSEVVAKKFSRLILEHSADREAG